MDILILLNYYTVGVLEMLLNPVAEDMVTAGYAAVLLNDNERIVYIGGRYVNGEYLKMSDIYIYNTKVNQWYYQQNVGGDIPGGRESHSAVISK